MHAPCASPVHACFVRGCCAVVVPEHDLRKTRQRQAIFTLQPSHPALRTSHLHFTFDTSSHLKCELFSPHLTSSQLFSPHPISPLKWHQSNFSGLFHLGIALIHLAHLFKVLLNSPQPFCLPESSYCQREISCTNKTLGAESFCTQYAPWRKKLHLQNRISAPRQKRRF